ncbi:hypothetical protein BJ085DRAFT_38970 [Dimargaris cristalligena]|uniref:RlpA-like double-psi beta-barrel-protein domain-containing protein-containing protein n=1 Tax=Dimargaris cristalligena TaxID=215637 RepID=A0A4P9ZVE8_9FUNG|nr:hypothetical protein BJ085DRAFT_38970 [Dimargaris cristalligena]|eukprot:RKP36600.1 hypothetical protein BJ085DRAFT_38970 [Dimargaris cristalligena]
MKFVTLALITFLVLASADPFPNYGLVRRQVAPVVPAPPAPVPAPALAPAPVTPAPAIIPTVTTTTTTPDNSEKDKKEHKKKNDKKKNKDKEAQAPPAVVPAVAVAAVPAPAQPVVPATPTVPVQPGTAVAGRASYEDAGPKAVGSCGTLEELATLTAAIVKIADTCDSCPVGEIVLSLSAANALGPVFVKAGRAAVTWTINP